MRQVQQLALLLIVFSCAATSILAGDIPDWVPPDAVDAANTFWRRTATSVLMTSDYGFRSNEEALNCTLGNPVQMAISHYAEYDPSQSLETFYRPRDAYLFAVNSDSCLMATIEVIKLDGEWREGTTSFMCRRLCNDYFGQVHDRYTGEKEIRILGGPLEGNYEFYILRNGMPETVLTWIPQEERFEESTPREWLAKKRAQFDMRMKHPYYRKHYERVKEIRKQQEMQEE
ncbi:MAG: hypothetical protein JW876_00160 [Candidatus Krumholzibacteriota bacterium]|nr:hypothetical protein [Candidatus Krumholzibacteriota bacterium]